MADRQPVFAAGTIDAGVAILTSLGRGLVVVDLLHVISIIGMSLTGWSMFFKELALRTGEHDIELAALAAPATIDVAEELTSASGVRVIPRGRPRDVVAAANSIGRPVVAVWAVDSITNARIARRLAVPLVAAARMKPTWRSTLSRRIADTWFLTRTP